MTPFFGNWSTSLLDLVNKKPVNTRVCEFCRWLRVRPEVVKAKFMPQRLKKCYAVIYARLPVVLLFGFC